ncbi:MAG: hypothetical protein AAFX99_30740, partial [Myxococcota bacterium]
MVRRHKISQAAQKTFFVCGVIGCALAFTACGDVKGMKGQGDSTANNNATDSISDVDTTGGPKRDSSDACNALDGINLNA